jgi:hypothetical protein
VPLFGHRAIRDEARPTWLRQLPQPAAAARLEAPPRPRLAGTPGHTHRAIPASATQATASGQADRLLNQMVQIWSQLAIQANPPFLLSLPAPHDLHLQTIFRQVAAATLRRHLGAWRTWALYAGAAGLEQLDASHNDILEFIMVLVDEAREGRGRQRAGNLQGVVAGMRFLAARMNAAPFLQRLASPLISAHLQAAGTRTRHTRREAIPLPLWLLVKLEKAFLELEFGASAVFLGTVLLMVWSSLRFSDVQRCYPREASVTSGVLRSWSWRSKSSREGQPFGALTCGFLGRGWGERFHAMMQLLPSTQDHLLAAGQRPASFTEALNCLRDWVQRLGCSPAHAKEFTLHSLKATFLSFGLQVNAPEDERTAQGHHANSGSASQMRSLYSRDDVLPQLRCQHRICWHASLGWRPLTPHLRGGGAPLPEERPITESLVAPSSALIVPETPSIGRSTEALPQLPAENQDIIAEVSDDEPVNQEVAEAVIMSGSVARLLAAGLLDRPPSDW